MEQEEKVIGQTGSSPVRANPLLSFTDAIILVKSGSMVRRISWEDKRFYVTLRDHKLMIYQPDGLFHQWLIDEEDLEAKDWSVVV